MRVSRLIVPALALAVPAGGQRISYPVVPTDTVVLAPSAAPRIAYPPLPRDDRLAEVAVLDDLYEPLPTEAEQHALALRVNGQDYAPRPAVWRIGDRDTTIYLLGTIHVLPPGFVWRNAAIDRIVAESHTLIVESVDDAAGAADLTARPAGAPALPPLSARVSPDHRAALAAFMAGLPPEAARLMDGLPNWIAAVAIGFVRDARAGEVPGPGADAWLEARFAATGRPVETIEDGRQVLASVNAIPPGEQRRMLDRALDAPQPSRAAMRAPLHAWAKGEIGPGSALTVDLARTSGSDALTAPLLTARNRAWATRLKQRLTVPGTMLFAAGAGHFIGRDSVLDLLGRSGVRVTRVQ